MEPPILYINPFSFFKDGFSVAGTSPKAWMFFPLIFPQFIDFNSNYNIAFGDEILMNSSGTDAQHIFDHNRIFTNLSYKPNSDFKFDIGYIYISRLTKSNIDLIDENNFYLNFTFSI